MGNSEGDIQALLLAATAVDLHGDKLAGALAIPHQALRQGQADLLQGIAQGEAQRRVTVHDHRVAGGSCCHQHTGIIGGGITVHGNPVEGGFHRRAQQLLQQRRGHRHIRGDIGQHGRHVRTYHARALGYAGNGVFPVLHPEAQGAALGPGVRGHDARSGVRPALGVQRGKRRGDRRVDRSHRQRLADNAGGEWQHLPWADRDERSYRRGAVFGRHQTGFTGTGIGIARVDQQVARLRLAETQVLPGHRNRRGAKGIAGKHGRAMGALRQFQQHQVLASRRLDAGRDRAQPHPRDGVQFG